MYYLNYLKAHSPLVRTIVWASVIVYGANTMTAMLNTWAVVTVQVAQSQVQVLLCTTDTDCDFHEVTRTVHHEGGR